MAIGTTAAILGGATLVAGIGGSIIGGNAQKKAAGQAVDSQLQMNQENNALAREFRAENTANFASWLNSGGQANALVDSFLYGGAQQAAQGGGGYSLPTQQPNIPVGGGQTTGTLQNPLQGIAGQGGSVMSPAFRSALMGGEPMMMTGPQSPGAIASPTNAVDSRSAWLANANNAVARAGGTPTALTPRATASTGGAGGAAGGGMSGYEAFQNSPYYQFPLQEGMDAINHGYAGRGALQSGAAMKAINKFGQDYGAGRMDEFIGLAERQSGRGLQAAGGIAGVGINALNTMSSNNQNAANAMSNAAIANGNATAGMWSGIGSTIGTVAGGFMPNPYGSSYGYGG